MKVAMSKTKKLLLAGAAFVASALFAVFFSTTPVSVTTNAATLTSTQFQTDGASVRVFKREMDGTLSQTTSQGIRFHVEIGNGYTVNGKTLLDTADTSNANGSYKMAEGYKTYTLVIPKRLHSGEDITVETSKVMKIDTTEFWYSDANGNLESVAYIYGIPANRYTDEFSFRGVICAVAADGTETVVAYSNTQARSVTYVAKNAYVDTIDNETNYWGSEQLDNIAAPLIKAFIPTYNVNYVVNGSTTTEEVLWGDAPVNAPEGEFDLWFDETNGEEIDLTKEMTYAQSGEINLVATDVNTFVLTGVAASDEVEIDGKAYSGAKVYATLHADVFADKTEMNADAVTVNYAGTGSFGGLEGVWTIQENGKLRLFFAFDSATLNTGDTLTIAGDSVFYANGVMYKLTENYVIDYTTDGVTESYGMYLGNLHNADIEKIENCAEDSTPNDGVDMIDEWTIRMFFYEDVLVDGSFTFEHATQSNPVYIKCGQTGEITAIEGGTYYWINGQYRILELIDENGAHKVYGEHNGDELFFKPGTKLNQNGGYYLLEDEVHVRYNGYVWAVGNEMLGVTASGMSATGDKVVEQSGLQEIRITTAAHWTEKLPNEADRYKVSEWKVEKRDANAPYAIYHTAVDGTISEIPQLVYHGQSNGKGGYFQILGIRGFAGQEIGETITIAAGTYLWIGGSYVAFNEQITYYFNGSYWVQNFDESQIGELNTASFEKRAHNQGDNEIRIYHEDPLPGYTTNDNGAITNLIVTKGSVTVNGVAATKFSYQRWDANATWFCVIGAGIGKTAFGDKLVIAAGTTIWGGTVAYTFTEDVEWLFIGSSYFGDNVQWVRTSLSNVTVTAANYGGAYNDNANGGEIRLWMDANGKPWLNDYQGTMAIDTAKPVLYNGMSVAKAWSYGPYSMASLIGYQAANDGDCFCIPAGATFYTPNNGSLTFADEAIYTFVDGAWKKGDYRATISITANASTVSGLEHIAKGKTYSFTITPGSGSTVAKVTINGKEVAVSANNRYTLTAEATNTVVVETIGGYSVTFNVANGIIVDDGAITNGAIRAVVSGGSLTFKVEAVEGHRIGNVIGATDNGDGTYTVSNVTANKTVTITSVKQYKVTYVGNNTSVYAPEYGWGYDNFEIWLDNNETVTFTVNANNGYTLISVTGATNNFDGTYTLTVNGSDFTVTATAFANSNVTDITDTFGIENRDWGAKPDEYYFGLLNNSEYLNTSADINSVWNVTWDSGYAQRVIDNNFGVDIMEYIYINGQSARAACVQNGIDNKYQGGYGGWIGNGGVCSPVYVETTSGSAIMIKVLRAYSGESFDIVFKAGFTVIDNTGKVLCLSQDVGYTFNGTSFMKHFLLPTRERVDITDTIGIENRDWGAATDEYYFGLLNNGAYLNTDSSINNCWYVGNNDVISKNYKVDIMQYIYVNGVSARDAITQNCNSANPMLGGSGWLANKAASPVYVETTEGSGIIVKLLKAYTGDSFTITLKAGFSVVSTTNQIWYLSQDVTFVFENNTIVRQ